MSVRNALGTVWLVRGSLECPEGRSYRDEALARKGSYKAHVGL